MPYSFSEQIECVKREIGMRKAVYPRLVAKGSKTQGQAAKEIELMQAVEQTLVLASRSHLDKSFNRPQPWLDWKSWPDNKPESEGLYLLCLPNAHFINKPGFPNRVPPYCYQIANWDSIAFDCDPFTKPIAFAALPEFKE